MSLFGLEQPVKNSFKRNREPHKTRKANHGQIKLLVGKKPVGLLLLKISRNLHSELRKGE